MSPIDELLHDAMVEHAHSITMPAGSAALALRGARRRTFAGRALATAAATVTLGTAGAIWVGSTHPDSGTEAGSARPLIITAAPSTDATSRINPTGPVPAGLAAVALPDPAPAFSVRRLPDGVRPTSVASLSGTTAQWVATFVLATPDAGSGAGVYVGTYASPLSDDQNTVATPGFVTTGYVIDGKPAALYGADSNEPATEPVLETRTVQGHVGYVFATNYAHGLFFSSGRFSVTIVGDCSTDQLVAVGDALTGLQ
jgi:hypothetical protein